MTASVQASNPVGGRGPRMIKDEAGFEVELLPALHPQLARPPEAEHLDADSALRGATASRVRDGCVVHRRHLTVDDASDQSLEERGLTQWSVFG